MNEPTQITLARLRELGIRPDTRLGQHFLVDDNLVRVALRLAALRPDDVAYEVGPGLGVLTAALAEACTHVHAVELDRRLAPALERTLRGRANVTTVFADALDVDVRTLEPPPTALVANLPYQIATPLVINLLAPSSPIRRFSVMVQREVADRWFAVPSTPAYSAASVLVQLACERTGLHPVSRAVFAPRPRVDSAIVAFARRSDTLTDWDRACRAVHAAFATRRKTLANNLAAAGLATRAETEVALADLGRAPDTRAEALAPRDLLVLARALPAWHDRER